LNTHASCTRSASCILSSLTRPPPRPTPFPYTTLFRSVTHGQGGRQMTTTTPPVTAREPVAAGRRGKPPLSEGARAERRLGWLLRSEEHTSELQSLRHLVCRLLLEKKKRIRTKPQANGS